MLMECYAILNILQEWPLTVNCDFLNKADCVSEESDLLNA